ncbi:uncharacterized protein LOC108667850, partial [Hyalella azteca]|uniref:Uncharacterized protein LOC108667850 n=1 Tax=Hyalella azteca TaxID=294128 RepID=A0A8B7NA24_HYAAZ
RRPPAVVSRLPKSDSVVRGHSVNLTCVFEGSPLPTITWYKDDVILRLDDVIERVDDASQTRVAGDHVNTNTMSVTQRRVRSRQVRAGGGGGGLSARGTRRIVSSLSIGVVEDDHAGVYKCVATSREGRAEQQVQLSVIPPLDPGLVYPCPYDSFCLNGGTCMFFKFVGELVCQ